MSDGVQSREINPEPRSVKNTTGADIPYGTILQYKSGSQEEVLPATAATQVFAGVAGQVIKVGEWGRAVIRGVMPVLASATLTQGTRVTSAAAGKAATAASGNAVLGVAQEAGDTDELVEVELVGPGGLAMP